MAELQLSVAGDATVALPEVRSVYASLEPN
jgi:hypothetical protein